MICKQCGNEIAPGSMFCGVCGAVNKTTVNGQPIEDTQPPQYGQPAQPYGQPVQPQYGQPVQSYGQPMQPQYGQSAQPQYYTAYNPAPDPVASSYAGKALGFGIASLALVCTFWLGFLSIIFGAIAKKQSTNYAQLAPLSGRAKTGRILGTIGFVIGIIETALLFIILLFV